MRQPKSLGGRLALFYVSALVVGLVIFAGFALVTIDRVQRASTDSALASAAAAAASVVLPEADAAGLNVEDVSAFRRVLGARLNGALFDARGRVKFSTTTDLPDTIATLGASENAVIRDVETDGTKSRAVVARVSRDRGNFGTIVLWRPVADFGDVDRRVALGFAVAIPPLALVALVVGRRLARRALKPLRALSELIAEIEAVDLSRRLRHADDDELGALCATFDRMLERLENAFLRQRRFAGDVAHELRTPLAVVIAEIDVVRRKSRGSADYERVLDTVREKALALDRLTTDLLASYRDDSPLKLETFRLRDAVAAAVAAIVPLVAAQRIRVAIEENGDAAIVADRSDVVRALLAIFDNARKYGSSDGAVVATVDATASDARVTIRDAGPGFSPEALQRATDRFWRDKDARIVDGSGLGLALARAVVERSGGLISLGNGDSNASGGVVTLSFPRADVESSFRRRP